MRLLQTKSKRHLEDRIKEALAEHSCFLYLSLFFFINTFVFFADDIDLFIYTKELSKWLIYSCGFYAILKKSRLAGSLFCVLILYQFPIIFIDMLGYIPYWLVYVYNQIFYLLAVYQIYKQYNLISDKIDKDNVCFIFYKPRTFKQYLLTIFGLSFSSFGMIVGKYLYQLRLNSKTIKKSSYKKHDIYENYLVINTGVSISLINKEKLKKLLTKRARQFKTLYIRINCLRCFKDVLSKLKGYEYKGEVLPSIYLRRLYVKQKRTNI